jgi:hypothetical protein
MKLPVRFLKEVDQLEVAGRTIGPFDEGERAELWRWEAEVFQEEGLAEVETLQPIELKKRILAEEMDQGLQPLPANFYEQVRYTLRNLAGKGDKAGLDQMTAQLRVLLDRRVMKLFRFVFSPEDVPDVPPEERLLLNVIFPIVERWMADLARTGEEVTRVGAKEPV